jgi:hypothetical protein
MVFSCSPDGPWRHERLLSVLEFVHRNGPPGFDVFNDVARLEDHEGLLTVTWSNPGPPPPIESRLFATAWERVHEPACNVIHES